MVWFYTLSVDLVVHYTKKKVYILVTYPDDTHGLLFHLALCSMGKGIRHIFCGLEVSSWSLRYRYMCDLSSIWFSIVKHGTQCVR